MAITGSVLAEGQLPNTKTAIYTVPASTTAFITFMSFVNVGASTESVKVYVNPGGTSRKISGAPLGVDEALEFNGRMTLEAGDLIEAETTTAASVDYIITGGIDA